MLDQGRKEGSHGNAIQIQGSIQFEGQNRYMSQHRGRN